MKYQKNELVYSKRTPHLQGLFLRDGVGKYQDLVEVACNNRMYYYPEKEIVSCRVTDKKVLAKCHTCKKNKPHSVNCKYTHCMICKYKYFGHRDMSCCLGPMQKYYQLKCTKCHALVQVFGDKGDKKAYFERKLEKGCLKGLMKLQCPAPLKESKLISRGYLSNQTDLINKIIQADM